MNDGWPFLLIIGLFYLWLSYEYYRENQDGYGSQYEYSNVPLTKNGWGILFLLAALICLVGMFFT